MRVTRGDWSAAEQAVSEAALCATNAAVDVQPILCFKQFDRGVHQLEGVSRIACCPTLEVLEDNYSDTGEIVGVQGFRVATRRNSRGATP